jgi:hypothetical protein
MGCKNSKYNAISINETQTEIKDSSLKRTIIELTQVLGIQRSSMHWRYRETHLLHMLKENIPKEGWVAIVFRPLDSPVLKHPPVVYNIDQEEDQSAISVISICNGEDIIMLAGVESPIFERTIEKYYYSKFEDFVHELDCNWVEKNHFTYIYPTPRFKVMNAEIACKVYHRRFSEEGIPVDFTNSNPKPFDWERYAGY